MGRHDSPWFTGEGFPVTTPDGEGVVIKTTMRPMPSRPPEIATFRVRLNDGRVRDYDATLPSK